jgi:osmotically-inducible protein OsmY
MKKTSLRVLGLIARFSALPLVAGLAGCASGPYNQSSHHPIDNNRTKEPGYSQSSDQHIEDSRTAERVREALAARADYRYDGVQVAAIKGVVQLSGFVNTRAHKNTAGEVASKVMGVKDVLNDVTVKE